MKISDKGWGCNELYETANVIICHEKYTKRDI